MPLNQSPRQATISVVVKDLQCALLSDWWGQWCFLPAWYGQRSVTYLGVRLPRHRLEGDMNFSQCRGIYTGDVNKVPESHDRRWLEGEPSSCFESEVVVTACDTFHVRRVVCVESRVCCWLFISVEMRDCTSSSMALLIRSTGGFGNWSVDGVARCTPTFMWGPTFRPCEFQSFILLRTRFAFNVSCYSVFAENKTREVLFFTFFILAEERNALDL